MMERGGDSIAPLDNATTPPLLGHRPLDCTAFGHRPVEPLQLFGKKVEPVSIALALLRGSHGRRHRTVMFVCGDSSTEKAMTPVTAEGQQASERRLRSFLELAGCRSILSV